MATTTRPAAQKWRYVHTRSTTNTYALCTARAGNFRGRTAGLRRPVYCAREAGDAHSHVKGRAVSGTNGADEVT